MTGLDYSGRVLDGRYRVLKKLARGGMGTVYLGEHALVGRKVAIKVLHAELGTDEEMVSRFYREARAAAAIGHRNIIDVLDVGATPEGDPYLVMEYLEGESLGALLQRSGRLDLATIAEILGPVLRALQAAHDAGIVHRDLKPENIFLAYPKDGPPVVKVIDFGISKVKEIGKTQLTQSGAMIGTPAYMAPEQARGDTALDHRADIYSVGVIFYELLTGRRPFQGENHMALLAAILTTDPSRPSDVVEGVHPDAERIVLKTMRRDPAERYGSAQEMLADLEATVARITGVGRLRELATSMCATTHAVGDIGEPESAEASEPVAPQILAKMVAESTPSAWSPSGTRTAPKRRRLFVPVVVVAVLGIAAGFALWALRGEKPAPAAKPISGAELLSKPGAQLACPIFETAGVEEPSAWFGAAGAALTCEWATIMIGGLREHTLVPAQLLDLPTELVDDFPDDPYCEKGAREKSLGAAKKRAAVWLDGRVESRQNDFEVKLRVVAADGRELGKSSGSGRALYQAVRAALEGLVKVGAIPFKKDQDARAARWGGIRDTDVALANRGFFDTFIFGVGLEEELAKLEAHRGEVGLLWPYIHWTGLNALGKPTDSVEVPALDRSSPDRFALTALSVSVADPKADRAATADELAELRRQEKDPLGRSSFADVEMWLRSQLGQDDKVRSIALAAVRDDPRGSGWNNALAASAGQKGSGPAGRAWTAWLPFIGMAWSAGRNATDLKTSPQEQLEDTRRGVTVAPDLLQASGDYAVKLIRSGQPERARSLAARLSTGGPDQRAMAEAILGAIERSEGRFEAAMIRSRDALLKLESFGFMERADILLRRHAIYSADVLGRVAEVADAFAQRFVLGEQVRLAQGSYSLSASSTVCAQASRDVAARCFSRLRELDAKGWFVDAHSAGTHETVNAAERFSRGDLAGAAAFMRPLAAAGVPLPHWAAIAFDAVGEHDLASKVDEFEFGNAPVLHGATLAHVREAKRAFKRKDYAKARQLAQTVIDAWSTADAPVPSVDEMRALLAKLPK